MFKINIDVQGTESLGEYISYIKKLLSMKTDKTFQTFIQDKCLNEVKSVSRERLGGTTNDEYITEYINRHKIKVKEYLLFS